MTPGNIQDDSLLDLFVFETTQNTEQLEQIVLSAEREGRFSADEVNDVFRIMHTIKGSSAMMSFSEIASLAHQMEDLFFYIRENITAQYDPRAVSDLILACMDYIIRQLDNVRNGRDLVEGGIDPLVHRIEALMAELVSGHAAPSEPHLNRYHAVLMFEEGCEMEDIRAYAVTLEIAKYAKLLSYEPAGIMEDSSSTLEIRQNGFVVRFETDLNEDEARTQLLRTALLRDLDLMTESESGETGADRPAKPHESERKASSLPASSEARGESQYHQSPQSIVSVSVNKLDLMMDLMGELVIAKTMVAENPEIIEMASADFKRSATQLSKIVTEMQELVMSMRLVPLSASFHRMQRIVRDMSKSLNKDIRLSLIGEETSVDKNVIEHIGDPLIHLVRNAIDHGIETAEDRAQTDKDPTATLTLEAQNAGGHVLIMVSDDGRGLNREKILTRARENQLLTKPEAEYTDREIYNMIFLPGFSTKESVTEFSGRGVGMDVVLQNISTIGGSVSVESDAGKGTRVILKIPLTIAILDGMNVCVGDTRLTVPISAICESFKPRREDILYDINGNEMIMVRGDCYAVLRLHRQWQVDTQVTELSDGILVIVEQDGKRRCVFVDRLTGRQQVVVKTLPTYLKKTPLSKCLSGMTLLSDGSISMILDAGWLVDVNIKGYKNGGNLA